MNEITLDAALASKLEGLTQPVQVCTPTGRVLGQFIPELDLSEWEPVEPDLSEEELAQREQSTEWYTTDEVIAHLESLEKQ
jgi:hypothetical protein